MDRLLKVEVIHEPGLAIVKLDGEARLDVSPLEIQLNRLAAAHPRAVILDMSGLSMISSLGMGLIVSLRNTLKRRNGRLLACAFQPLALESFQRAGLEGIFERFDTLPAARAAAAAVK
jgi:anti-sigma B factor antagonist/serine/threonine-protein kinase RsbW